MEVAKLTLKLNEWVLLHSQLVVIFLQQQLGGGVIVSCWFLQTDLQVLMRTDLSVFAKGKLTVGPNADYRSRRIHKKHSKYDFSWKITFLLCIKTKQFPRIEKHFLTKHMYNMSFSCSTTELTLKAVCVKRQSVGLIYGIVITKATANTKH